MENCIFCKIVRGEAPSWKVWESEHVYAFLDINPVNEYHTLVIPRKHYKDVFDTPAEALQEIAFALKAVTVQIINSSGSQAQQDVFHIHFHIVPRHTGDGQNIRWKVFPEWREKFDALLAALE